MMKKPKLLMLLVAGALAASSVAGQAREDDYVDLAQAGWRSFTPPGKRPAQFFGRNNGVIEVRAESAVSFLYKDIGDIDFTAVRLAWRWRVDRSITPTDLERPGADDRPLAIHVWFPEPDGERSLWNAFKGLFGIPAIGHAVTYVWGGTATRGEVLANPHLKNAALIVLRGGDSPTNVWFTEEVDPMADFARAFGQPPSSAPRYVAISADSDDTGETVVGQVTEPRILTQPNRHEG